MQVYARRCLIALAFLVGAGIWVNLIWARRAPLVKYAVNFAAVPRRIGDLVGKEVPVEQRIFQYLGADVMEELQYEGPGRRRVNLSLVYGTDWRAVHSPLSCYPQQGWQVDEKKALEVEAPPGCPHPGPLKAEMLLVHQGSVAMMALYVFAHRGGTTNDWVTQGWEVSRSPKGTGGLMLSLSTTVQGGDTDKALGLLKEFLGNVYLPAVSFWYKTNTAAQNAAIGEAILEQCHERIAQHSLPPSRPSPPPGHWSPGAT